MNYHEALAATEVTVRFTAEEARRLADHFNALKATGDHLAGRMSLRFTRAVERAEAKARKAVAP
jgi:hypothetical protein